MLRPAPRPTTILSPPDKLNDPPFTALYPRIMFAYPVVTAPPAFEPIIVFSYPVVILNAEENPIIVLSYPVEPPTSLVPVAEL